MMKCRLRESRLIAINEGERSLTAADVSAVYQINGDETKHSALDRMLCDIQQASTEATVNAARNSEWELHLRLAQSRGLARSSLFSRRR